jgi:hypothetical protein
MCQQPVHGSHLYVACAAYDACQLIRYETNTRVVHMWYRYGTDLYVVCAVPKHQVSPSSQQCPAQPLHVAVRTPAPVGTPAAHTAAAAAAKAWLK